jgi:hypothetical protein
VTRVARACGSNGRSPHPLDNPDVREGPSRPRLISPRGWHHPNVVGIRELEECDDDLFLKVMDYVEGADSPVYSSSVRMPEPMAVRIVLDRLCGLAEVTRAHRRARIARCGRPPRRIAAEYLRVDGARAAADSEFRQAHVFGCDGDGHRAFEGKVKLYVPPGWCSSARKTRAETSSSFGSFSGKALRREVSGSRERGRACSA